MDQALEYTMELIQNKNSAHVVTLNPEMIAQANAIAELNKAINEADIIVPDGVGIILGLKINGIKAAQVPGIEYSEQLISLCSQKGYTIGMIGASEEVVNTASAKLLAKYPELKIVYKRNGFFSETDEPKICEEIQTAAPDVLFVALGVPKQELWISKYKKILNHTIMVGVGGSFDVWANKVKRAPLAFRKLGLEWFFRLLSQPSRFKRMFPTLPLFLIKVILKGK